MNDNSIAPVCPICSRSVAAGYAPFCSKRCADVDLHRWLSGGYAIPAEEEDVPDGDEEIGKGNNE